MNRLTVALAALQFLLVQGCHLTFPNPDFYQEDDAGDDGGRDAGTTDGGSDVDARVEDARVEDARVEDARVEDARVEDARVEDAGPPGACSSSDRCGPVVPVGWSGPIVLMSGPGDADPPACPGMAPDTELTVRSGSNSSPARCGCDCADPEASAIACSNIGISPSCAITTNWLSVPADGCIPHISNSGDGPWAVGDSMFMALGGCTPQPSVTVEVHTWDQSHRACSLGVLSACEGGGTCLPPLTDGERLCIYRPGDSASCPPEFPDEVVTADNVEDTRGCSTCECGTPEGTCSGRLQRVSRCEAPALLYDTLALGMCIPTLGPQMAGGILGYVTPSGSCAPQSVTAVGTARPTGVRTFCCEAP